jgi:hypothetical protein
VVFLLEVEFGRQVSKPNTSDEDGRNGNGIYGKRNVTFFLAILDFPTYDLLFVSVSVSVSFACALMLLLL